MASRIKAEIQSRRSRYPDSYATINGRLWTFVNSELSEVHYYETSGYHAHPGHWAGKRRDPITMLIRVGILRRQAAATPAFHLNRRKLIAEARSVLQAYRAVRREEQRQQINSEAA